MIANASEAREVATKYNKLSYMESLEYNYILYKVEDAANEGKLSMELPIKIFPKVTQKLLTQGFTVASIEGPENRLIVSW